MPVQAIGRLLTEPQRRDVFRLLVAAQDCDMTVAESRQMIMETRGLTNSQVIEIEQEGVAGR